MSQVVIGDILPYTQATAILNQTVFGTNWTADVASDVVVYQTPMGDEPNDVSQILAYPAGYSVAFIGSQQDVQVTLVTPAGAGDIITITRQTPADRENLYSNTNFTPSMLNSDFGILTLVDQQAQLVDQKIGPRYNYSAIIVDVVDTILPILEANQVWVKDNANTAIIAVDVPASGFAPAGATYVTYGDQTSTLPNSYQLLGGANVTLTPGPNTLTISVTGQAINPGSMNDLAYYAADGSVISPLPTANDSVLATNGTGVPAYTTTLPTAVQDNITRLGTIVSGIWNGTTISEIYGGTNQTSYVLGDMLYASATDTLSKLAGNITTVKQYLSQTGTGAVSTAPVWATITGGDITGAALSKTDDTNVTLTLGGTPTTSLLRATSLILGWAGQLSVPRGGTGNNTFTANSVICAGTTAANPFQNVVGLGTSGQSLVSNGAGALPTWQAVPTSNNAGWTRTMLLMGG